MINLDRQQRRWADMLRELGCVLDKNGRPLPERVVRHAASDAQAHPSRQFKVDDVIPTYRLADQLFVEPQPSVIPGTFDLEHSIEMSDAEIAVATSHISVWRSIANSAHSYSLVLEDDVWFQRDFGQVFDQAWREMELADRCPPRFDILYVSFVEVRHGAPKERLSDTVFRPERGLWCLAGYVLSRNGAQRLLDLLPCRGPIDLWLNHKFAHLDVRAVSRSVINQRRDLHSTNSYSILPALTRMGVLDYGDAALFHRRLTHTPVFAFGAPGSGLTSLAMALSMLGYRCCSDFDNLPESELNNLLARGRNRVFDAYVNIGVVEAQIDAIARRYPDAKYIVTGHQSEALQSVLAKSDVLQLRADQPVTWKELCGHLSLAPPNSPYPTVLDLGQRVHRVASPPISAPARWLRRDPSPWIAKSPAWNGIAGSALAPEQGRSSLQSKFIDDFSRLDTNRWFPRNDTFPGNLALFQPGNLAPAPKGGLSLVVKQQSLGVRNFSAAALSSRTQFLFGRFEATFQATRLPGLVTGFFLHRNSPRQEIDVEIRGNQPNRLLANVFYNPGSDGDRFDYGYRGTPVSIELNFDASKAPHRYAIEWEESEIRWFVDDNLVHRRTTWGPTPIPHLPMTLHVNTWPTNSRELAGKLSVQGLPALAKLTQISVDAYCVGNLATSCRH
ncbi:MAG: family 16 glycosylhydrolase [Hyphomonadaceae bacterium]|nr:family 16 glycosylhydrolase [Hyphomonadaceae bacterium]